MWKWLKFVWRLNFVSFVPEAPQAIKIPDMAATNAPHLGATPLPFSPSVRTAWAIKPFTNALQNHRKVLSMVHKNMKWLLLLFANNSLTKIANVLINSAKKARTYSR